MKHARAIRRLSSARPFNLAWKTAIPGAGASTPIIWGNTIYLQTAVPVGPEKPPVQQKFAFGEQQNVYYGQTYTRATRDH